MRAVETEAGTTEIETMSDNEINEAIAKECGWVCEDISSDSNPEDRACWSNSKTGEVQRRCPDYVNDLNLMAQAEDAVFGERDIYHEALTEVVERDNDPLPVSECRGTYRATARQRAEAFLNVKQI